MKTNAVLLCIALQILVLVIGAIFIGEGGLPKESSFAFVLVFAVAFMLTTLFVLAAGFAQLKLTDKQQALGLPSGSVRAMIALILILVFIMFGIYLYLNESTYWDKTGPIEMQQDAWATLTNVYSAEMIEGSDPPRYEVVLIRPRNEGSSDLAQQLLTTVGTLVVAVAGFYFGSASTASGASDGDTDETESDEEVTEEPKTPVADEEEPVSPQGSTGDGSDAGITDGKDGGDD